MALSIYLQWINYLLIYFKIVAVFINYVILIMYFARKVETPFYFSPRFLLKASAEKYKNTEIGVST